MMLGFNNKLQCVLLVSLVLLVNAQRSSNFKDVDIEELARQNKITKQILEAYIQKKLGIRNSYVRPPSIHDILPMNMKKEKKIEEFTKEQDTGEQDTEEQDTEEQDTEEQDTEDQEGVEDQDGQEIQGYSEDDSLQSVESEQIDSIYDNEGRKKYPTPPFEPELEPNRWNRKSNFKL